MTNPTGLLYAKVVGMYQMFTADSVDGDDLPDFVNLEGDGVIVPNLLDAKNLNPGLTSTYLPEEIPVTVDDGVVSRAGNPYVMVLAPSPGVTPLEWNYNITLWLRPVGSDPETAYIKYGPFNFDPVPDPGTGVVDLAVATPVAVVDGAPMVSGPPGAPGDQVPAVGGLVANGTVTLGAGTFPSTRRYALNGNSTVVLPTPSSGISGTITLVFVQDGTGGRTITWPNSSVLKWADGIVQQPASAANAISIFNLLWTGNYWYGMVVGKSFA